MLAPQPSDSDNHYYLDQKGTKNMKYKSFWPCGELFELIWKVDGRTGDLGQWMSAPCCALLQEPLRSGRVVAVGKITYRRFRRQSFVSAGALCVGPAHLSACAFYLLKDGRAAALLKYVQPEALSSRTLLSSHQNHSCSRCSKWQSTWLFTVCPIGYVNPPCYKALQIPRLYSVACLLCIPTPSCCSPVSTKDIIKMKGHRETGQCALSK